MKRSLGVSVTIFFDFIYKNLKPATVFPGLLLVVFLTSALASLAMPDRRAIVLWFPDSRMDSSSRARPELRYVTSEHEVAKLAATVVQELLLGPLSPGSRPVTVPDARLLSAIRSKKTLYVDVSNDILFGRFTAFGVYEAPVVQPKLVLDYIEHALKWNFPFFRIVLTVEGQEPSWIEFEVPEGT